MRPFELPPDHDLQRGAPTTGRSPEPPRSKGAARWIVLAVAGLLVGAGAVYVFLNKPAAELPEPAPIAQRAPEPADLEEEPSGPPISAVEADDAARSVFSPLSGEPEWAAWLTEKDLLRRLVGAVNALADGESPRANVPFLAPKTAFAVIELEDGGAIVDPASWERYEPLGRVIRALDVGQTFEAFKAVSPLLEQFHREGARPGDRFPKALERGLDRIIALPLPEPDAALVPAPTGAAWLYADSTLEELPAAEKHLLRLGPTILGELKQKATELKAALDRE